MDIIENQRTRRVRGLERMIDYAIAEARELTLPDAENLLGAARLAVSDSRNAPAAVKTLLRQTA